MNAPGWTVVMPVKRLPEAKRRLRGTVARHEELVLAMVCDTVAAVLECPLVRQVLVVTDDLVVADAVPRLRTTVLADPAGGLNAALAYGAAVAARQGGPVAALTADLPALRPAELTDVLAVVTGRWQSFVADAAGTGTTLLAAPAGVRLRPQFGPGSARAHRACGARPVSEPLPSLRLDVDTAADLAAAVGLGVGPRTQLLTSAVAAMPTPGPGRRA